MSRLLASVVLSILAACASSPEPESVDGAHEHRIATMVTVTPDGIVPGAEVHIPAMSTVVWRNQFDEPLDVDVDAATCAACETVHGFLAGEHGASCKAVTAGGVASLCFHRPGSFPYVARVGGREMRGTIVVGEPR